MRAFLLLGGLFLAWPFALGAQPLFPATEPGRVELKTLPAGTLLKAAGQGDYFGQDGSLFLRLFRFISDRDVAMTTPVEAQVDNAAMYFWVAEKDREKARGAKDGVESVTRPTREVASAGAKGSYSRENYLKTKAVLQSWLSARGDLEPAGEPYAVFWSGPFTPWFAKRYEVHQPVRRKVPVPDKAP